jgi:hypothetical protein
LGNILGSVGHCHWQAKEKAGTKEREENLK